MMLYRCIQIVTILMLLGPGSLPTLAGEAEAITGAELIIALKGIETDKAGQLIICLYQGGDNWLESERAFYSQILRVGKNDTLTIRIMDVPADKEFAIQVIHDENSNGVLDFQWFPPKPKEGVGVSNNKFRMGPPDYNDAKIILNDQMQTIQIDMHY